ncbi:MAG: hypothetical protein ACOYLH_07430 [Flavobacteriales bacterium]|jgi:hypothetical protein
MRLLAPVLLLSLLLFSCDIINPDEQEPGFIYIDQYDWQVAPGEGTESHKFTEIWVYDNNQIIGVYDLPAKVPVLAEGSRNLSFFAGIKSNGLSAMRLKYPLIEGYEETLNIQPLKTDTVVPVFRYFENLDIVEKDFDGNTPTIVSMEGNQAELSMEDDESLVFEGDLCGYYHLPAGSTKMIFKDDQNHALEQGNTVFLELDYSSNNMFSVGLISREGSIDNKNLAVIINPTTETIGLPVWNKIYIDLGLIVQTRVNANYFELYFEASPDNSGDEVELFLDNIKLVQFQ